MPKLHSHQGEQPGRLFCVSSCQEPTKKVLSCWELKIKIKGNYHYVSELFESNSLNIQSNLFV